MRVIDYTPKFQKGKDFFTLVWTGDWHLGSGTECRQTIDLLVSKIKKEKLQWLHGGDIIDAVLPKDKRADIQTAQSTLIEQIEDTVKLLKPIAETGIGLMSGNHEQSVARDTGNFSTHICNQTGLQYLTVACFVTLNLPGKNLVTYAAHHTKTNNPRAGEPERREANAVVRLREAGMFERADLKMFAHIHHFICTPPVYSKQMYPDGKEVKLGWFLERDGWHLTTPTMRKFYTLIPTYEEAQSIKPSDIGWAEIDIHKNGTISEVRYMGMKGKALRTVLPQEIE
jgi:hypothetical protein